MFTNQKGIDKVALNILRKRYFHPGETTWEDVTDRIVNWVLPGADKEQRDLTCELISNLYFIPNSPCIVNAGTKGAGLVACFVVDFKDTIEDIYKTKLEFALIAKKGGGCGTTLSKIRPKNSLVHGSVHGFAGGPVAFYNTICHDMEVITQGGFRAMAMMGTYTVYGPDIVEFITAKTTEGMMTTTNISVVVDDAFMRAVEADEMYQTYFDYQDGRELGPKYNARDIFKMITDSAWKNGEPGLLFYERMNDSPYKYSEQEILATNPCGEQPLPVNGACNLGSLDISKFLDEDKMLNLEKLEVATRLAVRFLDSVIDATSWPTLSIKQWAEQNRPIGLGIMGLADYYLLRGVTYGTEQSLEELSFILAYIKAIAEDESITMGEELGVPAACDMLPVPRRNITLMTVAPTGTISLIAGSSSGIEPIFSEITIRNDKTGTYEMNHISQESPHFRCAVSANGAKEVTIDEHLAIQNTAQKFVDAGVSKTINAPTNTTKAQVFDAFLQAWKLPYIKGITLYRNGSRGVQVLTPKNLKKDLCPLCGENLIIQAGCKKCSKCSFKLCEG